MSDNNRIKFALYLDGWNYEHGDKRQFRKNAIEVTTTEYTPDMKDNIFCPECCVGLFRSPQDKEFDSNGRKSFFSHSRRFSPECGLRVKKAEGKKFDTEEQAKEAIENEELVVIKNFMKSKPASPDMPAGEYDGDPVEDQNGGLSDVPISRHNGESFNLPSRVTTVRGICRNFNKNIHRYFHFPGRQHAILLQDFLINIANVTEVDDTPKLYFGTIDNSYNCGKTRYNIRQTMFRYKRNSKCMDFCLKAADGDSQEHGISDDSKGKIVILFGAVTESGIGLCIENVGWGEFAVLPAKYEHLLK